MSQLTPAEQDRIAAAVAEAEARTSAEIACVVDEEVSDYRETPLAFAAAAALLFPPLAFALGAQPLSLEQALGGWSVAHSPAVDARVALALTIYAAAQAALFVAVALIVSIPAVRRRLTPGALKDRRVGRAAQQYFLALRSCLDEDRRGVLIFASVEDHRLEVIADPVAHAALGAEAFQALVKEATDEMRRAGPAEGLVAAVRRCGELLAGPFPDDGRGNAIPNRPLQV